MKRTIPAILAGAGVGLAALLATDRVLDAAASKTEDVGVRHFTAPHPDAFPNVELQTHDGRTVRFYEDLVEGKIVAINFMYVSCKSF